MTASTQDIRFACAHCGQRIVVEATAAGVETECPGCREPVVIPAEGAMLDRESVTAAAGRTAALERELGASRKEIARLQEQLRAGNEERKAFQSSKSEAAEKLRHSTEDLEVARERVRALEAEAAAVQTRRAAAEQGLAEARAEIVRLQEESGLHRRNFDEAREKLAVAEKVAQRVPALETELGGVQEKLAASLDEGLRAGKQCEALRTDLDAARRELIQTESGRELAALRTRFGKTEEGRKRLSAELAGAQAEARRATEAERELRAQFDTMRHQRDEALSRADAGSHSALQHGNDVLRGILDRQKSELDERYTELRRLRSAQLTLRILYALGGLLFIAAIVLGLLALNGVWR